MQAVTQWQQPGMAGLRHQQDVACRQIIARDSHGRCVLPPPRWLHHSHSSLGEQCHPDSAQLRVGAAPVTVSKPAHVQLGKPAPEHSSLVSDTEWPFAAHASSEEADIDVDQSVPEELLLDTIVRTAIVTPLSTLL